MAVVPQFCVTAEDLLAVIEELAVAVEDSGSEIAYANFLAVLDDNDLILE